MDSVSDLNAPFPILERLRKEAPASLDLTSKADLDLVVHLADELLSVSFDPEELRMIECETAGPDYPLALAVAAKLALSKAIVSKVEQPHFLSVVFAVYKEHNRIRKPAEHPHGEDFLVRKVRQLSWLFEDSPHIGWELIIVDDGCPDDSGKIAEEIVAENDLGDHARVLFLEEAIQKQLPPAEGLGSTACSQKGGSILYGMWDALQAEDRENHVVLYTDADLSTHLGQIGLLIESFDPGSAAAAIGSRREPTSVVVKTGGRNTRGKLFIYLWKRLVSVLPDVIDTQCAFKAFRADVARKIILPAIEKKFAFDIELLIKTALLDSGEIAKVPVAWIDSEAASTTAELDPYLRMLQSIEEMYRKYLPDSAEAEPFARLIDSLDADSWNRLCENVPPEIAEREPFEFGAEAHVSAETLREAAN